MFTVTLMAQPGGLEASTVEAVYGAWGGSQLNWLSGGEAAAYFAKMAEESDRAGGAALTKSSERPEYDLLLQRPAHRRLYEPARQRALESMLRSH